MSDRYKGAILSPTAPTVTPQSAGGIYTSSQQFQYQGQGVWPTAVNYPINNSLRFRSSASAYLNRTPSVSGSGTTFTWSGWVKRGILGGSNHMVLFSAGTGDAALTTLIYDLQTDQINFLSYNGATNWQLITSARYRDPSAWYHVMAVVDTTQATSTNRIKLYVNGSQITDFSTSLAPTVYPSQNYASPFVNQSGISQFIGRWGTWNASHIFDGYMAEINFIDGLALTPSSFGTTDAYGIWQPIPYTGTYGTNGFYLKFTDNSALTTSSNVGLGKDFSGNGNYWVTNNISITAGSTYDSMVDVPTNTNSNTANYAVMNPLDAQGTATLTNANLTLASSSTTHRNRKATFVLPSSGKWYWELVTDTTCSSSVILGWGLQTTAAATDSQAGNANTWMAQNDANQDIWNQTTNVLSTGSAVAGGSIRQVAYDADTGNLWFGINNSWYSSTDLTSGNPSAGTNPCITLSGGQYFPTVTCYNLTASVNFGQQPFSYTPPTGFNRLNTYNLPTPTILAGNQYMDALLYTGNGSASQRTDISWTNIQPDMVWVKSRSNAYNNDINDDVRGVTQALCTNSTAVEDGPVAFGSDGFGFNGVANQLRIFTSDQRWNANAATYVAWGWKGSGAAGVSNTQGTITSTVSANTTAGFSIVTYTGTGANATVGHGLGVAPSFIIAKARNSAQRWTVYTAALGNGYYGYLNETFAFDTANASLRWNTAPTSSVFGVGTSVDVNGNTTTYVAYCFAAVSGYSAFGSYTGNGSSDGPFVYLGFRPRFVLVKRTDSTSSWGLIDTARDTYNVTTKLLFPNASDAENTSYTPEDILSNGFKLRDTTYNVSSGTYIYMAFAENPFKISRAR